MTAFQLHLLGNDGRIIEKKTFKAIRNYEAVAIAERYVEAATHKCYCYEVWRGDRMIQARKIGLRRAGRSG